MISPVVYKTHLHCSPPPPPPAEETVGLVMLGQCVLWGCFTWFPLFSIGIWALIKPFLKAWIYIWLLFVDTQVDSVLASGDRSKRLLLIRRSLAAPMGFHCFTNTEHAGQQACSSTSHTLQKWNSDSDFPRLLLLKSRWPLPMTQWYSLFTRYSNSTCYYQRRFLSSFLAL